MHDYVFKQGVLFAFLNSRPGPDPILGPDLVLFSVSDTVPTSVPALQTGSL